MAKRLGWQASDGSTFPTKKETDKYEAELVIKEFFGDRVEEILVNADRIIPALRMSPHCTLNKRGKRKNKEAGDEGGDEAGASEAGPEAGERRVPRGKAEPRAAAA